MSLPVKNNIRRSSAFIIKDIFLENNFFFENDEENFKTSKKKLINNVELKDEINNIHTPLKRQKKKNNYKQNQKRFSASTLIKKNSSDIITSLINIKKDNNPINSKDNGIEKQNKTFTVNAKIKQRLLKDYNNDQKYERKYRKINKISNLYDSMDDYEESNDDESNGLNFHIPSDSTFVIIFDFILIIFSLYSIFFIPLSLARRKYYCEKESNISMVPKYFTEIIFMLDFIFSTFKSYYNYEYKKITLTKKIIKHYLRTEFALDFIEAIPSYIISRIMCNKKECDTFYLSNLEIILSILLIMKSFKIFKALSQKRNKIMEILYESISEYYYFEQLLSSIIYVFRCFCFFHTLICIHIFLGKNTFPNWLTSLSIQDKSLGYKYLCSFYFIMTTMTTVGYGDIVCVSPIERNFQIILLAIGTVVYSFIITKFGNYIEKKNDIQIELNNNENLLEQIRLSYPLMPFKLYYKIHNYLLKKANKEQKNKNNEICMLVNSLPDKIRNDILTTIYKDVIINFKIFKDCKNSDFIIKMLTCFIQTTCKKNTILMLEGQQIDSIIFVKDGRLILEATVDLLDPFKSMEKYFKENFRDIEKDDYIEKKNSLVSKSGEYIMPKSNDEEDKENDISFLKERINFFIENSSKNINNKNTTFVIDNKNDTSFQMKLEDKALEEEDEGSISKSNNEEIQYLKILDIRKNEYFGDVYMFLERPAPLTLKVKSKISEIFALKKKDAMNIYKSHHNIMKRIQIKSYKNLVSIKKKTFKILKKFCDINKFKNINGTNMQDMSWFNEKSRSISIMDKTNISNISKDIKLSMYSMKNAINNGMKNGIIKNSCLNSAMRRGISKVKNTRIRKSISTNSWANDDKIKKYKINNYLSKGWFQRKISKYKENTIISNKLPLLNKMSALNPYKINSIQTKYTNGYKNYNENISLETKTQENNSFYSDNKNISQNIILENKTISKINSSNERTIKSPDISPKKNSSQNMYSFEIGKDSQPIMTLNNINSDMDKKIRKRIKSRVRKEKIIKLWKLYIDILNSQIDKDKIKNSINKFHLTEENREDIINKISEIFNTQKKNIDFKDLNSIFFNKLNEYLSNDIENDVFHEFMNDNENANANEKCKHLETKIFNKRNLESDQVISFNINSSYYNINTLTKGKMIKNNNYKKDIKTLIKQYMEIKNEKIVIGKNRTTKFVNKHNYNFNFNNIITLSPKSSKKEIPDIDEISSIASNPNIDSNKHRKKTSTNIKQKNNLDYKMSAKIFSRKIKKNKNSKLLKNFNTIDIDNKKFKKKFNESNKKNKINFSNIINNSKNNENRSISSSSLLIKEKNDNDSIFHDKNEQIAYSSKYNNFIKGFNSGFLSPKKLKYKLSKIYDDI